MSSPFDPSRYDAMSVYIEDIGTDTTSDVFMHASPHQSVPGLTGDDCADKYFPHLDVNQNAYDELRAAFGATSG